MTRLRLDWCSYAAARFAVRRWHYSRSMPIGKLVKIGVWEDGRFCGAVIFGRGASMPMYKRMGAKQTEVCELTRVALGEHETPTSRVIAIALRMLRRSNPGMRAVVSFADESDQGHLGTVYQATNWWYLGPSFSRHCMVNGKLVHSRMTGPPSFSGRPRKSSDTLGIRGATYSMSERK